MSWLNKFLLMEEINGHNVCPTYLFRWTLLRTWWFAVYLHHFVGDDWSRDMHDHPKRFLSIGLRGRYVEETPEYENEDCWTLAVVFKAVRPWGFWHAGQWVPWREYIGSDDAKAMKSCE